MGSQPTPKQALATLRLIYPLLARWIFLSGQLPIFQQGNDTPCIENPSGSQCTEYLIQQIEAYGIDISTIAGIDFLQSNEHLWQLLNALETVGQQIKDCLKECMGDNVPNITPSTAFKEVFPTIRFLESNELSDKAKSGVVYNDTESAIVSATITFPEAVDYYRCVDEEGEDWDNEKDVEVAGNDCPDKQKGKKVYTNPSTYEGIIRHEIGHIFLNMLLLVNSTIPDEYIRITGSTQDTSGYKARDLPNVEWGMYFPNATRDTANVTEDFSDTFSIMGRFVGDGDFYFVPQPRPEPSTSEQQAIEVAQAILDQFFHNSSIAPVRPIRLGRMPDTLDPVWIISVIINGGEDVIILDADNLDRRLYVPTVPSNVSSSSYRLDSDVPEIPADEEVLENSSRVKYFQNNFCCWVAQILGIDCGCS